MVGDLCSQVFRMASFHNDDINYRGRGVGSALPRKERAEYVLPSWGRLAGGGWLGELMKHFKVHVEQARRDSGLSLVSHIS